MADLLTLEQLRLWTREPIIEPDDVAFAELVIAAATQRVSEYVAFADWLADPASKPYSAAASVAAQVARRAYLNPDQETRTAAIGPIGGVSYLEAFASGLDLTETEMERLDKALADFGGNSGKGLFVLSLTREPITRRQEVVLNDDAGSGIVYASADEAWRYGA